MTSPFSSSFIRVLFLLVPLAVAGYLLFSTSLPHAEENRNPSVLSSPEPKTDSEPVSIRESARNDGSTTTSAHLISFPFTAPTAAILELYPWTNYVLLRQHGMACGGSTSPFACPYPWAPPPSSLPSQMVIDELFETVDHPLVISGLTSTCVGNIWHATVEYIIPLVATLLGRDPSPSSAKTTLLPYLYLASPDQSDMWGSENKGCPFYRTLPYGVIPSSSPGGAFLSRFFAKVLFYSRHQAASRTATSNQQPHVFLPNGKALQTPHRLNFQQDIHVGINLTCSAFPSLSRWPFFLSDSSDNAGSSECVRAQLVSLQHLRVNLAVSAPGSISRAVSNASSGAAIRQNAEGTNVLFVLRQGKNHNGRLVLNMEDLLSHMLAFGCMNQTGLHAASPARCVTSSQTATDILSRGGRGQCVFAVVCFEQLSISLQTRLVRWATVFISPRGAATTFAGLLRPGSTFLSLFPAHSSQFLNETQQHAEVSVSNDNFPWWPFPYYRHDITIGFVPCATKTTESSSYKFGSRKQSKNCLSRSPNYCDMTCDASSFKTILRRVLDGPLSSPSMNLPSLCGGYYCEL